MTITSVILVSLVVSMSYRQTIFAYPKYHVCYLASAKI